MQDYSLPELISFLDGLPEPRIVMDAQYRILAANRAYRREFGADARIVGQTCYAVSHHFSVPCDQAGEACPLGRCQESGQAQRVLHLHHTPRGEEHVEVELTPIRDRAGILRYFVETLRVVRQASGLPAAQGLVGRSAAFVRMLERMLRVARSDAAVLLRGETGTGKELVAQAIHETSERRGGPFVAVDCAGLTESLFEAELFGYEKGAFTGATHRKHGLVESASGGTLFLDEIGELPVSLQVKLLRLLETGTFRRVGGLESLPADFRLISATHRDLPAMVDAEQFRRDLYFRINTFPIHTPALHERPEDISLLADALRRRVDHRPERTFTAEALAWLRDRRYSGNIRELRNLIERACLMADGEQIALADLQDNEDPPPAPAQGRVGAFTLDAPVDLSVLERRYLDWLLGRLDGDIAAAAAVLGVSPRTLYRKRRLPG